MRKSGLCNNTLLEGTCICIAHTMFFWLHVSIISCSVYILYDFYIYKSQGIKWNADLHCRPKICGNILEGNDFYHVEIISTIRVDYFKVLGLNYW